MDRTLRGENEAGLRRARFPLILLNATPTSESIPGRFAAIVSRFADRTAISTPGAEWPYAELGRRSDFIAAEILERIGEDSEPVALLMEHNAPLIAAILGTLKANKIYLALEAENPRGRLTAVLADSQARLLLTDKSNLALAKSLASENLRMWEVPEKFPEPLPWKNFPEVLPETGAWLMYTSGSTGEPKGVWQNHCGIMRHLDVYRELIKLTPHDRLSLLTPCSLSAAGTHLFGALLNGATLCPFHVRSQGVERLAVWLRERRITIYHSVPTIFRHLARTAEGKKSFESVRLIRLGGEPLLPGDVELFRQQCPDDCRLMNSFSSTETGFISALMIDKHTTMAARRVPVGYAVPGVEILLVDEAGQPIKNNGEGRIAVRSALLRQGYWRQPEATAEKFRADSQNPQFRIFISNDWGRFLSDGSLEHLGRADQLVKIRGQLVDLSEVETALLATELVEEAAVTAPEDVSGERRLLAYFVPRAETDASSQNFRRVLRGQLPEHMIPNDFVPLEKLPQTPAGKLDRRALVQLPRMTQSVASKGPMPRYNIEGKLAQIWRDVLSLPKIGRQHDFFDLGGTSLQSARMLTRIEEAFNVVLPASTLAEHSTIEALALLLADRTISQSDSPLVVLRTATTGRPLFFMHNGMGEVSTYGQLARRLPDRPIYALQARGLHGESWPIMRIPDMVRCYLPAVIAADPTGPYLLAGTCTGALVAFEMAQQLVQSGRSVGLVALFDSPTPPFGGQRSHWSELTTDRVRDAFRILRWSILRMMGLERTPRWLPAYRHFVSAMTGRSWHLYRPVSYPGKLTLFQTAEKFAWEDRRALMAKYAVETQTITIPGNRAGLFVPPAVDELARQLQSVLELAEGKGPT